MNIKELQGRDVEQYLVGIRNSYVDSFSGWKTRIEATDAMIRGEWSVPYPDGTSKMAKPKVMNLMDTQPRDIARLVSESTPSVSCMPMGEKKADIDNANLREQIARTYWAKNRGDLLVSQWAMDLVITGTAFACIWADAQSPYPHITRRDPRFCYPDVVNGMIQDLLVVQRVKARVLQRQYPDVDFGIDNDDMDDFAEVWEYYSREENILAASPLAKKSQAPVENGVAVINRWSAGLECAPIAFAQLPSPDGGFRGMLDQLADSLVTKNRMVEYSLDIAHQYVYAPFLEKGVLNPNDEPGPSTIYHLDPQVNDAQFGRVAPAPGSPQVFNLLSYLDDAQRGQAAYPSTRQGEVPARADSAAFVASTQGQLTSVVRNIQFLIGDLRKQATTVAMEMDSKELDFKKPLVRPAGKKVLYLPSKDIAGNYEVEVVYGAGAGLDRQSADVRLLQYYGNGAISAETMLENTDFVADPQMEIEKRQREELERVALQRFGSDPSVSLDYLFVVLGLMDEGMDFREAVQAAAEQVAPQPQVPQPGEAAPAGPPGAAPSAPEQQAALEQGQVPQGAPTAVPAPFSPPPLEQVFVR